MKTRRFLTRSNARTPTCDVVNGQKQMETDADSPAALRIIVFPQASHLDLAPHLAPMEIYPGAAEASG